MLGRDKYNSKRVTVVLSLLSAIIVNNMLASLKKDISKDAGIPEYGIYLIHNYTLRDIINLIYSSPYLSSEEKDYLYNEDFFSDILPYINERVANRIKYYDHFHNMDIIGYGNEDCNADYAGYYDPNFPNDLFVKNYNETDIDKDTVAHELIHLCQKTSRYNVITEACAEIISFEYFDDCRMTAYIEQVKIVKKLMEIIGPDLIWDYNFTGDFTPIENAVKPYLSEKEYLDFLDCLSFDHEKNDENMAKFIRLNELIRILYKNINNETIDNAEIFKLIDDSWNPLTRYYFNKRKIDQEHSYYVDKRNKEFARLTYQEAIDRDLFFVYAVKYDKITYEEAMRIVHEDNTGVRRDIDYRANDIQIKRSSSSGLKTIISGTIDGVEYEDANVDELFAKGIIDITYYSIDMKILNGYEYEHKLYQEGATLYELYPKNDLTLCDGYLEGMVPRIVYIEPVNNHKDAIRTLEKAT